MDYWLVFVGVMMMLKEKTRTGNASFPAATQLGLFGLFFSPFPFAVLLRVPRSAPKKTKDKEEFCKPKAEVSP